MNNVKNKNIDVNLCVDEYIKYLKKAQGKSDNTLASYRRDINMFSDYCAQHAVNLLDARSVFIDRYINSRTDISNKSRSRIQSSLRSFYKYLCNFDIILYNPTDNIKSIKYKSSAPEILSEDEILDLLSYPDMSSIKGIRERAMLEVLCATGMKVSELINLKIDDIDFEQGMISAGEDKRMIPVYKGVTDVLREYIEKSRVMFIKDTEEKILFINLNGAKMTRQGFWKILKACCSGAGIKKNITVQTFRHSFAANMIKSGADARDVQGLLGSRDIAATLRYSKILKKKI